MNKLKIYRVKNNEQIFMGILIFVIVMLIASACNLPVNEVSEGEDPGESVDPNAQLYRMYFDNPSNESDSEFLVREFTGQIRLADLEALFGNLDEMPQDEHGNYVCGPTVDEGTVWSLVANPSQSGFNLMTSDLDGTHTSAVDLDGDSIADIVDMRLGDGRRFTIVTEALGMDVFEEWLMGGSPLCNRDLGDDLGFAIWGCGEDEEGGGGGSGEGFVASGGAISDSLYIDPLDQLCAEYDTSRPGFGMNRGLAGHTTPPGNIRYGYQHVYVYDDDTSSTVTTAIYEDADGNWTGTQRIIREYDENNKLVRTIVETVDSDGTGQRTIVIPAKRNEDGSVTLPRVKHQDFEARPDATGDYNGSESNPPTPGQTPDTAGGTSGGSSESASSADPPPEPPPDPPEGDTGNPGPDPFDDDTWLADLCAHRGTPSGVEQAAETDPTTFHVSCGDLVGGSAPGEDCTVFDWARAEDFQGALEPGDDDGCGEFEQRGPGGDCEPTDAAEMLRGRTSMILSANLQGVVICPPILCNPELFDQADLADREDIVPTSGALPSLDCSPPTLISEVSSEGVVTNLTLCNRGPGPGYKTVSSLKVGVTVEILGTGAEEGWLVVDNPIYPGEACWARMEDIQVPPELNLESLREFGVPSLPDKDQGDGVCKLTQGECANQGLNLNSAKCKCE